MWMERLSGTWNVVVLLGRVCLSSCPLWASETPLCFNYLWGCDPSSLSSQLCFLNPGPTGSPAACASPTRHPDLSSPLLSVPPIPVNMPPAVMCPGQALPHLRPPPALLPSDSFPVAAELHLSDPSSVPVPRPLQPLLMVVTLGGCPLLCLVLTVPPTPGLGFSPEAAPLTFAWWILAHPPAVSLPGHLPQPETQLGCTRMHSDAHTCVQTHTHHIVQALSMGCFPHFMSHCWPLPSACPLPG